MKTLPAAMWLCAMAFNESAWSADSDDVVPGLYFGAQAGAANYDDACQGSALSCDSSAANWGLFAGFQLNRHIRFELGYLDLGQVTAHYPRVTQTVETRGDIRGFDFSALLALPLAPDVLAYVRGGGFLHEAETHSVEFSASEQGWSVSVGAGVAWRFADAWQTRLQYQYLDQLGGATTGQASVHTITLGLSYWLDKRAP